MSFGRKRCSSGASVTSDTQSVTPNKQTSPLPRSKTCSFTGATSLKSKTDRLQPLASNTTSQLNDETLPENVVNLHPAMVNELSLHSRGLTTIPNLSQFSKLQILDISCNNLIRIDNLRNLSSLRELKLYGNKIERIENLECLTQLQCLQLQYNEIKSIGTGLIYLTRLQSLRLDANKLSNIRADEVLKLAQLKIFDVSDCSIENLDFINTLSSIAELRACHCRLKVLPNQFRNLRDFVDLDLSNNEITQITPLKTLSSLRILHLANNHIQDIQVLSNLVHLNELDLNNNKVTALPNSFDKLIDLQCLNLANNRIKSWDDISIIRRMNSLFILNVSGNAFLEDEENPIEKLLEWRSSLEVINDINLQQADSKVLPNESDEQLMNIEKELNEVDQTVKMSMAAVQAQFDIIIDDLRQLIKINNHDNQLNIGETSNGATESDSSSRKSKHRLFQALTFSEENYSESYEEPNDTE